MLLIISCLIEYILPSCNFNTLKLQHLLLIWFFNIIALILGFTWMLVNIKDYKKYSHFYSLLEGRIVTVKAKVLSVAYLNSVKDLASADLFNNRSSHPVLNVRLDLRIKHIVCECTRSELNNISKFLNNSTVRVNWFSVSYKILPGDFWELSLKLKKPRNYATLGSRDIEKYYFAKRIKMLGVVLKNINNRIINTRENFSINRIRWLLIKKFTSLLDEWHLQQARVISALWLGVKHGLSEEENRIFEESGTSHLLAISGLHVGLVSSYVFMLSSFLWRMFACKFLLEKITAPSIGALASICVCVIYVWIAGFNIPTIRALIMITGCLVCVICRFYRSVKDLYYISLIFILILDPFNSLIISFWLSYLSVGILLYGPNLSAANVTTPDHIMLKLLTTVIYFLRINWLIFLGLIPINIWFFGKVYWIAYLANLIAVPTVSFFILPWIFFSWVFSYINLSLSKMLILFADLNLNYLMLILKFFLKFNQYCTLKVNQTNFVLFFFSLIGTFYLLLPKGFINKYVSLIYLLPIIFDYKYMLKPGEAIVSVLDVGQGLGIVIKLRNNIILYDVGPKNLVTVNYLKKLPIDSIDQVIISHTDQDHIGNLPAITKLYKIKKFFTNTEGYKILDLSSSLCQADTVWELDGVTFKFFGTLPEPGYLNLVTKVKSKNDNSCVLKMSTKNYSILYTGDITKHTEKLLVKKYSTELNSDVLLIPHHGSSSSSTEEFINMVDPKYAIVSAGYMNRYDHPKPETLSKYLAKSIQVLSTVEHGSIVIKFLGNYYQNIQIEKTKKEQVSLWNY